VILGIALFVIATWAVFPNLLGLFANGCAFYWGAWRAALRCSHLMAFVSRNTAYQSWAILVQLTAYKGLGQTDVAVQLARVLVTRAPSVLTLGTANTLADTLINAGRYSEALAIEDGWSTDELKTAAGLQRAHYALLQINLAEALYNMGRWRDAWERLADLDETAALSRISRDALVLQRAWILAHDGNGEEAWELARCIRRAAIPRPYWSEIFYTRAMALLGLNRVDDARCEVNNGLKIAKRASSQRNGIFLLGKLAAHQDRCEEAVRWFEEGARHPYRAQGGDGLLLWGDVLHRLRRGNDAVAAWRMAKERDPESESARLAGERLRAAASAGRPSLTLMRA